MIHPDDITWYVWQAVSPDAWTSRPKGYTPCGTSEDGTSINHAWHYDTVAQAEREMESWRSTTYIDGVTYSIRGHLYAACMATDDSPHADAPCWIDPSEVQP